jgi:starch synthase
VAEPRVSPAIFYHPDAFDFATRLMGRQSAGVGFLKAAVAGRGDDPVVGYGDAGLERDFKATVEQIDPHARAEWIAKGGPGPGLASREVAFRGDPSIASDARWRLRQGPAAFSITGITHTLSTPLVLGAIASLLTEPVEPWDALICTSRAALDVVAKVHEAEADYLRWRLGPSVRIASPQLPVIPLGVHVDDFARLQSDRASSRKRHGIADDEIVLLYAGRLNFHGKAHPYPLFRAAEAIAAKGGAKLCLVFYGRSEIPEVREAIVAGAAAYAPGVRTLVLDGATVPAAEAWACGDIFVSLADAIQETFGLTPVEAMAAGLPCVVTDWNGYRDTVRDGVEGFRVATSMPVDAGAALAASYEAGILNEPQFGWAVTACTSVDIPGLTQRLGALIDNPDLRRAMGESGRRRAREVFDWRVVYGEYQGLWRELAARRRHALQGDDEQRRLASAPRAQSAYPDPFGLFSHYATSQLKPDTPILAVEGATEAEFLALSRDALFRLNFVGDAALLAIWRQIEGGAATVREAAAGAKRHDAVAARAVGVLAKMGLVRILGEPGPNVVP